MLARELDLLKPSAIFINRPRNTVDEQALIAA
jgi:phosphoglycerate dehydrogenase-like enzyme